MKINKNKSGQIKTSIISTIRLLNRIIDHPSEFSENETIRDALKSQGALAGLTYTDIENAIQIAPLSITTLKAKVTTHSGGFDFNSYDHLRKQALDSLTLLDANLASDVDPNLSNDQPIIPSKVKLTNQIAVLESRLEKHREANFRLLQALNRAVTALENTSKTDDSRLRQKIARDEISSIAKTLLFNDHPFNKLHNPISIAPLHPES
ncbi:hypothetical protein [Pseudomonas sp. B21-047]|uniref:hypothetical protein n=1 Tax=Pseudomonas sp. B21-047 TaxID=2895489 RepID=UPI00215F7A5E|nr:hypothetical protein [Pseudomonas sp. B21-047]UVL05979.1 hypothetical protein LOY26_10745 [Pseudomonas sp. B21-047]